MDTTKNDKNQCIKEQGLTLEERNEVENEITKCHQNLSLDECNDPLETILKDQYQHEKAFNEINEAVACSVKSSKKLKNLNKVHDAAVEECKLILSDHNIVCDELNKLSEDLSSMYDKNKALELEIKTCRSEIKTLKLSNESLKRELSSAIHGRDKALKQCNMYQERFGIVTAEKKPNGLLRKNHLNCDFYKKRENQNDLQEQVTSLNLFDSVKIKHPDNLDQANLEIERLRKLLAKYCDELDRTLEEAEVSKKRRDWAIDERDKLVLDRERIQILYDSLKKQCNDDFNKLNGMGDFDDVTKQQSDHTEEHNGFKKEIEAQLGKKSFPQFQATRCLNQDSVIVSDLEESDTEILEFDLDVSQSCENLGIDLHGGKDDPLYPNDDTVYISSINEGSSAAKKLKVNDCILRINDLDCSSVSKELIFEKMRTLSSANIVVKRKKPEFLSRSHFTNKSRPQNYIDHGITLETGLYIKKITPGSMADKVGNLDVGDRVLSINNTALENIKNSREAMSLLYEPTDVLTIKALKSVSYTGNSNFRFNHDVFKKYSNSSTQTNTSRYLRCQEFYPGPQSKREMFDALLTPPRFHSPTNNYTSDSGEEESTSELESAYDAFTPYPSPTGSFTKHSRKYFNPNLGSKNRDVAAVVSTRRIDRTIKSNKDCPTSFVVEFLIPEPMLVDGQQSLPELDKTSNPLIRQHRNDLQPLPGDLRWISIKKSFELLGIQILCIDNGALFVAAVSKPCIGYKVGLQIGDRLLEVNGVNLRNTTYRIAEKVLRDCKNDVTMLVQYSPDKMFGQ